MVGVTSRPDGRLASATVDRIHAKPVDFEYVKF